MIHELKILPEFFEAVITGKKLFEVRKDDRPYRVGDLLALNEYNGGYTGRSCLVYVDYMLADSEYVKNGFVVMSIKPCIVHKSDTPFDLVSMRNDYHVKLTTDYPTRKKE